MDALESECPATAGGVVWGMTVDQFVEYIKFTLETPICQDHDLDFQKKRLVDESANYTFEIANVLDEIGPELIASVACYQGYDLLQLVVGCTVVHDGQFVESIGLYLAVIMELQEEHRAVLVENLREIYKGREIDAIRGGDNGSVLLLKSGIPMVHQPVETREALERTPLERTMPGRAWRCKPTAATPLQRNCG